MHELLRILLLMLARLFRERHDLLVENLLLRHQLHVALRSRPRPDLKSRDRFFWLVVRSLYPDWKQHLILVRPETVVRWHRQGWRLYWRWRSGHQLGRPRLSPEIRELIATMANENPLLGLQLSEVGERRPHPGGVGLAVVGSRRQRNGHDRSGPLEDAVTHLLMWGLASTARTT